MSGVLVIAESREGELRPITLELLGAARGMQTSVGGPLQIAVLAPEPDDLVAELSLKGVDEVLTVKLPVDHFEPQVHQRAVEKLIELEEPSVTLAAGTVDGLGYAPAVAAGIGCGFAAGVTAIEWDAGTVLARSSDYGGKVDVELAVRAPALLMLREGAFAGESAPGDASVRSVEIEFAPELIACKRLELRSAEEHADLDITEADFLLAVGRGVEDESDLEQFEDLSSDIGATLAVSRPLVDAGWASSARQVGQSGKSVAPKVYLAMGISGAVQHLAGIRQAGTVIAINSDPEAPIFRVADYGAVADMFDVADELSGNLSS